MKKIDYLLKTDFSNGDIFTSKPLAHWHWEQDGGHLLNASYGKSERYILIRDYDNISYLPLNPEIEFYEVVPERINKENYENHPGIYILMDEINWLGNLKFLAYGEFQSIESRELVEKKYPNHIYINDWSNEPFDEEKIEIRLGSNIEDNRWTFYWITHDSPFYMETCTLAPRSNHFSKHSGFFWFDSKEEAEELIDAIYLIAQKAFSNFYKSSKYITKKEFKQDLLNQLKKYYQNEIDMNDFLKWRDNTLEKLEYIDINN